MIVESIKELMKVDRNKKSLEELKKKKMQERIDKLKDAPCCYPKCSEKNSMIQSIQAAIVLEGGGIKPLDGMGAGMPFCEFHQFLAMGGLFVAIKKSDGYHLFGQFDSIEMILKVVMAVDMKKKMDVERLMQQRKKEAEK